MLRDRGEGNIEMGAEFLDRARPVEQQIKKGPPVRIGDGLEDIGVIAVLFIYLSFYLNDKTSIPFRIRRFIRRSAAPG